MAGRGLAVRTLLWSLPLLLLPACLVWHEHLRQLRLLSEAEGLLLSGEIERASARLRILRRSFLAPEQAQVSALMAAALLGEEVAEQLPSAAQFRASGSRLLLYRFLIEGEFEFCLRLAQLLERAGDPDGTLFVAAVLIEQAKPAEAARHLHRLDREVRQSWFGVRLEETLQLLSLDTLLVVEDRRGIRLGRITRDGLFEPARPEYRHLLPAEAIRQLCRDETSRSVRLTIDLELSRQVAAALRPYHGSIVVMEPETGRLLAAVSDPRTLRREPDAALHQLREPASIAKLITASAGLRAGLDVDRGIAHLRCRGVAHYGGSPLYCAHSAGRLSGLNEGMAVSCNIAFANVGTALGWDRVTTEFERFGFGRPPASGMDFGRVVERSGRLRTLADLSIGLECSEITPVHAALLAAVFANRGTLPEPELRLARDGILRLSLRPVAPHPPARLLETAHADIIRESMLAVTAPGGTAYQVASPEFPAAMKTGTGATPGLGYHTNYIGFAPVERPRFAFAVRVTGIRTSRAARQASYEVTRRLLRILARQEPGFEPEPANPISLTRTLPPPAVSAGAVRGHKDASRETAGDAAGHAAQRGAQTR